MAYYKVLNLTPQSLSMGGLHLAPHEERLVDLVGDSILEAWAEGYVTVYSVPTSDGTLPLPLNPVDNGKALVGNNGAYTWDWYLGNSVINFVGNVISAFGGLVLPKTAGTGIKVDMASPTFGWRDLLGAVVVDEGNAATRPTLDIFIGTIKAWRFDVGDQCFIEFHLPHDYVPGSDLYIHIHWSHNVTVVTGGSVTWGFETTYAKGHNQDRFSATVTPTLTEAAVTGVPGQYRHMISETILSIAGGDATHLDTTLIEVDGLILVRAHLVANNITYSGGGQQPSPFVHFVDVHYQSTNIATKNKAPNFYN